MPTVTGTSGLKVKSPRIRIDVTAKHIDDSMKKNSSHCMTAEAIKDIIPHARFVSVDVETIRYTDPKQGLRFTYLTPRCVQVAILNFDQGKDVAPFDFQLRTAMITQSGMGSNWAATKERTRSAVAAVTKERKRNRLGRRKVTTEVNQGTGRTPTVVGGRTPPRMGARREHGLRAYNA